MRRFSWLLSGVVLGFIAAHYANRTPEGRRFFTRLNRGAEEFQRAFAAGYYEAEPSESRDPHPDTAAQ